MYPRAFRYHRAETLKEASEMLLQLGEGAKLLAGGQSLIPLMKLRFANPEHLVDLNFVKGCDFVREEDGLLRFGTMARHAAIAQSREAARVPILRDCAAGIADVQVRNRGTIGGSLAEADPSGDWATVLMTLPAEVRCVGPRGERIVRVSEFVKDAFTTALAPGELVSEIGVRVPGAGSGGAYLAFKRSAPVYPTASAAVQLTMQGEVCSEIAIALGCVGLTPVRPKEAEGALRGKAVTEKELDAAAEASRAACDPQPDMRGSAEYKRQLAGALLKKAISTAVRRARGEQVEMSHIYA